MTLFDPDHLRAVTAGRWLQRIGADRPLLRVGIDSREEQTQGIFVAIRGERHDGHDFLADAADRGAGLMIVDGEPDCSRLPAEVGVLLVPDTKRALVQIAADHRRRLVGTRVIAVTGSVGKTTTKELIHAAMSGTLTGAAAPKSFNNEVGVPLTLLSARPAHKYLVVEIGTNAPGEISRLADLVKPDIAVVTTVGRSHLEGLGSVENVAREKITLLNFMRKGGLAIVNTDTPEVRAGLRAMDAVVRYGTAPDADLRLTDRGRDEAGWWFEVNSRNHFRLGLPGRHNALNALAAVAVARRMGLTDDVISDGLAALQPVEMRMSNDHVESIRVFNDAYNANPDSVIAAIHTFIELTPDSERRVIVLGDMLELGAQGPALHREIGEYLVEVHRASGLAHVVLVGELCRQTYEVLREAWTSQRVTHLNDLDTASLNEVSEIIEPHDVVLLKGSRAIGVDRVVDALRKGYARQACANGTDQAASSAGAATTAPG